MKLWLQELLKIVRGRAMIPVFLLLALNIFFVFSGKAHLESWSGVEVSVFQERMKALWGNSVREYIKGEVSLEEVREVCNTNISTKPKEERFAFYLNREIQSTAFRAQEWEKKKIFWMKEAKELTSFSQAYRQRYQEAVNKIIEKTGEISVFYYANSIEYFITDVLGWLGAAFLFIPIILLVTANIFTKERDAGMEDLIEAAVNGRSRNIFAKYFAAVAAVAVLLSISYWTACILSVVIYEEWSLLGAGIRYFGIGGGKFDAVLLTDDSAIGFLMTGYLHCMVCGIYLCSVVCLISSLMKHSSGSLLCSAAVLYTCLVLGSRMEGGWKYLLPGLGMMVTELYTDLNLVNLFGFPVSARAMALPFGIVMSFVCLGLCYFINMRDYRRGHK